MPGAPQPPASIAEEALTRFGDVERLAEVAAGRCGSIPEADVWDEDDEPTRSPAADTAVARWRDMLQVSVACIPAQHEERHFPALGSFTHEVTFTEQEWVPILRGARWEWSRIGGNAGRWLVVDERLDHYHVVVRRPLAPRGYVRVDVTLRSPDRRGRPAGGA